MKLKNHGSDWNAVTFLKNGNYDTKTKLITLLSMVKNE